MNNYGCTSLSEFLGDRVVYRNLVPADPNLPPLREIAQRIGIKSGYFPRKIERDYARVIHYLLEQAQAQRSVAHKLNKLLYLGDTRLLDGAAFTNLCQTSGWPGLVFIGSENKQPPTEEILKQAHNQTMYLANRWSGLQAFAGYAAENGFPVDECTAVVIDLDKTALGARGRNGQVIDQARVRAVHETVADCLGADFDPAAFRAAYDLLNQPEFHPFTADNQDYLAYVCLILGSGLYRLDDVVEHIRNGQLNSFEQFINAINSQQGRLEHGLAAIHAEIYTHVQAGDPTPFKVFRRKEYLCTITCFSSLPDETPVPTLLDQEILITEEVRQAALAWQKRGALLFGLSDKPDEAATPTPELAAQGFQPIHRGRTHSVGS
jgi:hypothetical protein